MPVIKETRDARLDKVALDQGVDILNGMQAAGFYEPVREHAQSLYVSGQIPRSGKEVLFIGRVGEDLTFEEGYQAASVCAIRALAVLRHHLGTLDMIDQAIRLSVYIQTTSSFADHTSVADGASAVLKDVLGINGAHSRTAIGVASLPRNAAVEAELQVIKKISGEARAYGDLGIFRR